MKILHIVAGDLNGGAARGTYWLHLGLKAIGVESMIFTSSRDTLDDKDIISTNTTKEQKLKGFLLSQLDKLIPALYKKRNRVIFSTGILGIDFTKTEVYMKADIIHLHWINSSFVDIKVIQKIDKPIVWTIRDMWPLTGGCHYSMDCENYKIGCGSCVQLHSNAKYDLSRFILSRKKKYLPKTMKIVGISHWLSEKANESELFSEFDIRTISNNINTNEFFAVDKKIARAILGITTDKKVILTGSISASDFYKGFGKYLEAIKLLDVNKYFLCFFGKLDKKLIDNLGFEYKSFGHLNDNISLRLVYSCADVFVAPSLMEAFGKTLAESMACDTPVVCFDATGPKDIVDHKVNGYRAKPFDTKDLANGIEWVLNCENYDKLCLSAREKVVREFDSVVVAGKYIELYKELLND